MSDLRSGKNQQIACDTIIGIVKCFPDQAVPLIIVSYTITSKINDIYIKAISIFDCWTVKTMRGFLNFYRDKDVSN